MAEKEETEMILNNNNNERCIILTCLRFTESFTIK